MKTRQIALAIPLALLLSGCGGFAGLAGVTLPGGPDLGSNPISVRVEVADALNLVPQASVKVDDVTVGTVRSIKRKGWDAEIEVAIRRDLDLPANTRAEIRQTGLLGEKYVELSPPAAGAREGTLTDGGVIGIQATGASLEVEEVLGALSLLLNGGGIDRLRTITFELRSATQGREAAFRDLLSRLDTLTSALDDSRATIDHALDGLDLLTSQTRANDRIIDQALVRIGPAVRVLADQRKQLTAMLRATSRLATVGTRTVVAVHRDLVSSLESIAPVLSSLSDAGDDLPKALRYALTFPFPDNAFSALKGDYMNVSVEAEIRETDLMSLLGLSNGPGTNTPPSTSSPGPSLLPGPAQGGSLLDSLLSQLGPLKTTAAEGMQTR